MARTYVLTKERRPNGYWEETILPMAAEIVESYDTQVTLRQVFYRLVANGMLNNTVNEYNQLSSRSTEARRDGWFPELADFTRDIDRLLAFESPAEAIRSMSGWYHVDRTEGQEYNLVLAVEKATLVAQVSAWFKELGFPIFSLRGYSSESHEREVAEDIQEDDRPCMILYAGDLDPSGEDLQRNFEEQLSGRGVDFDLTRVALELEQAQQLELPEGPGKVGDPRSTGFVAKYGRLFQIEVEALDPNTLRALFQAQVDEYWDEDTHNEALALEQEHRGRLEELADELDDDYE